MQYNIDLGKSFDQVAFVQEREKAETMISQGWFPIWAPGTDFENTETHGNMPQVSIYFILVLDTRQDK